MEEILLGLNPPQTEAVKTLSGPILILAGAGSGKTRVLTHRIANLIAHGVRPDQILAVTFTNKAASEMRERLWKLTNGPDAQECPRSFMPYMGTFHSICVRILRIEHLAAGIDRNFTIYDSEDQLTLIRRIVRSLKLTNDKSLTPKNIQGSISYFKNHGTTPEDALREAFYPNQKVTADIYARYEREKAVASALDFDDLLTKTADLFAANAEVRAKWQKRFQHILIDEYQDTNVVQYKLIKLLVGPERNICVVGDDWQSIYSWRGADFTNILNFERDFPGAKVIKLEQNYRSTGNILAASQKIISQNKTRTDKTLFTEAGDGSPVTIEKLMDETAEAEYVARKINRLRTEHPELGFSDFAVLYRTNAQSYAFEKAFIAMRIPYKIIGGVRFYDRKEVKDVLAILHLIVNPNDRVSFERVTKNILSGVGAVSLEKLFAYLSEHPECTLTEPDQFLENVAISPRARLSVARIGNFLREMRNRDETAGLESVTITAIPPAEIVERIVKYFDFATLVHSDTPEGEDRMKNLEVLASNASVYDTLEDFLADAALLSSVDETVSGDVVSLMTLHAAKGLEFAVVFMVGLEDGLFPSSRADDSEAELEEERRLAYVGMTRAMRELFLTYTGSRYSFGGRHYNTPSRFLLELGYNPYEPDIFEASGGEFGLLGGDPDGELSDSNRIENYDEFDPFPDDDLPVFD